MSEQSYKAKRIDAKGKVTGKALFPGDYNLPGQLFLKVLFAGRPHAIVHKVNISEAQNIDGVIAVLTSKDVPVNEYGLGTFDQPVLCGPDSGIACADHVRYEGDAIALVIAETEEIAARARNLISVDYEDLPIVTDMHKAMEADSILVHPEIGANEFTHYKIRKGNVEEGFAKADIVVEDDYYTPYQEHAYLQPEAGVSYIDEKGRITVVCAGQWVHEDQTQIAHSLNLDKEKIRVIYPAIGGAFGGREDMSVQIILALAVLKLHEKGIDRPVKITWNREESIIGHHKRHPYHIHAKWGATKEGILTAAEMDIYADGGAYVYTSPKVLGNSTVLAAGPYKIPNVRVDARAIYTNNIPTGAFRGFGGPQSAYAVEGQMNKLAEALKIDPVEIRMRNLLGEGDPLLVQTPLPEGVSIKEVVEACALKAGWHKDTNSGWKKPVIEESIDENTTRGIGFACGFKNVGFSFGAPENCWAIIELHGETDIDKVVLRHAGADVGQGSHTAFVIMAAKALNIPVEKIQIVASDTGLTRDSGSVSASRMTFMAGNAIIGAARAALEKWQNEERPAIAEYQYWAPKTSKFDPETGACRPSFSYGYVAQAAEVEIDKETGETRLLKVVCADDVGNAINPPQVEGQIEGGVVQAAGYALMENFIEKNGLAQTKKLSTYLIPTVLDIPGEVDFVKVEHPDPNGPWGARGIGEMPFLPMVPAITDAVHDALGVWINEFPLTAERVSNAIDSRK